jgi:hypothetical protein
MPPAAPIKSRTGRRWRALFRRGCAALLFAVLLVVAAGAYLHFVGLPGFLKQALLTHLRDRGFEVHFNSARLGWGPEVTVENAAFHRLDRPLAPRLAAGHTVIRLNPAKLLRRRVSVDSLLISQGSLQLPFSEAEGDFLSVNNVFLDLALLPNDTIRLKAGHAAFHGIQFALRGSVTNFMAAREWDLWPAAAPAAPDRAQDSMRRFAATLDKIHFQAPPRVDLNLTADGRDPDTLWMELTLDSAGVQTPWGDATALKLAADCVRPIHPGSSPFVQARLSAGAVATPEARGTNLYLTADISRAAGSNLLAAVNFAVSNFKGWLPIPKETNSVQAAGRAPPLRRWPSSQEPADINSLEAASLRWNGNVTLQPSPPALVAASGNFQFVHVGTPWGSADSATLNCDANAVEGAPIAGPSRDFLAKLNRWAGNCQASQVATPWGSADAAALAFHAAAVEGSPAAGDSWGFWAKFNRWAADWQASLDKVAAPEIKMDRLAWGGSWRAPELVLTNLDAGLYGGGLSGRARLDVASRELQAGAHFDFDARQLAHFLSAPMQTRLAEIQWERPPRAEFEARVVLPAWTGRPPDWAAQLLPTLQLAGEFSAGPSSFRGFALDSAQSRFACSNRVWDIPRLHLVRPGGEAWVDFTENDETGGFVCIIDSHLDPAGLRPLLPEEQRPLLDAAAFSAADPPKIHAEIRGRRQEPASLAVHARLAAANFTVLGEKVDGLETELDYSNFLARLADIRLFKDGGQLDAPLMEMDWRAKRFFLSNAVSTLDPRIVNRLLGPKTPAWLRVIGFDTPPVIHAGGTFMLSDPMATDLHFDIGGRNFRYSKLLAGTASGRVDWIGKHVTLTNVQADLYGGTLGGWCVFNDEPAVGTQLRGRASAANIQLPLLVRGWGAKSNNVEGVLKGNIAITDANTASAKSWTGSGSLSVNHAMLWDIRLFGIFSPMLNAIIPGAGNSRAYQAGADFVATNGMVATDNLEIRSTDFRLIYRGTLNTEEELDARVKAEVLRDTPILGPLISLVFAPFSEIFEYKIGGTLDAPTHQPLFIPKPLTLILEPFHKKPPASADDSTPP